MAYQFKRLTKGSTPIFSSGGYGFFRLSSETLPTPTTSLVYTISSDSSYYIVGTGFTSEEAIEADTSGGTAGSGLDSTWSGGELVISNTYNGKPVKAIAPKAFNAVRNITSLYIYDGITTIGHRCFQCASPNLDTAMTSCRLPNTVESLGGEAGRVFWGRQGITRIDIPESVTNIAIYLCPYCTSLTSLNVDENNPNYKSIDGNLYSKDGKTLIQYAIGKTATHFVIPDSVTSIYTGALQGCTRLTSIVIPDSVTTFGERAFYDCSSLTSVNMPNVTSLGDVCFENCSSLASVSMPNVESIGKFAFSLCTSLTSLTIPSTCTSLSNYALLCGSSTNKCTFTFEGTTPPSIQSNTFKASYINKIIVPVGCGNTYKTATNWSSFASYIEEATA